MSAFSLRQRRCLYAGTRADGLVAYPSNAPTRDPTRAIAAVYGFEQRHSPDPDLDPREVSAP
ncbi:hypothetical protein [Dyella acidiphila]|uniref:hypothetical protein n=1 Tax=Dyella acidiphila TaxID=2775866 RepID=UPI001CE3D61E|nr:hypothetical protein [Dyella acidiphila]